MGIADSGSRGGRRPGWIVSIEPAVHIEQVDLLGPEQPGERLPLYVPLVFRRAGRMDCRVEFIRLRTARGDNLLHFGDGTRGAWRQPEQECRGCTRWDQFPIVQTRL